MAGDVGDQELFSPGPADHRRATAGLLQCGADPDQRGVAGGVTMGVVELLEVIEVDHRDHQMGTGALMAHHQLVDRVVERPAIVKPRQRVTA